MCDTICGSFLHTFVEKQIFRELFLSTLSSQMCPVSSLARVRSETRRRRDFSQELSIKILKFKIRCVAFSGPSTLFYPRAYTNGGVGVKSPTWAWYFTKYLLPAQRKL